ncbi:MAG: ATP-binding protein [Planctomycetes bacterium]|nr:ATP-binding protein [Planctomycetota bacterium]
MKTALLAFAVLGLVVTTASAQRRAAEEVAARRANLVPGTQEWFESGCALVETELEFDARAALSTADALVAAASDTQVIGAREAAEALRELARATWIGPLGSERPAMPRAANAEARIAAASAQLRAHFHAARSRRSWMEDRPVDVLAAALAAFADAREAGEPTVRLRCAWVLHAITEREAAHYDAELVREIDELSTAAGSRRFEPWRRLNEYWRSHSGRTFEERRALVDAAVRAAEEEGDLRTLCQAQWELAVLAVETEAFDDAFRNFDAARATAEGAGHLRELTTSLELSAQLALDRGEFERAAGFLDQARAAVAGRGLPDKDVNLEHVTLRLAVARGDSDAIVAANQELDRLRREEAERRRGYAAVREQLLASERQRVEFQRRLAAEQAESRRTVAWVYRALGVALVFAAGAIAVTTWLSRRRLQGAHRRLEAEMRRTEAEAHARRELERRMRRLERTESLGIVAGGVAHEFNNLMTGVLGNAELLQLSETDPARRKRLDAILGAGERGAQLCKQLQTYTGDQPFAPEAVEIGEFLRALEPLLRSAAETDRVLELVVPREPLAIRADRAQLEQAVLNLIANARDAQAKRIRVSAELVVMTDAEWAREFTRGETRGGDHVRIEVEDDGQGMERDVLERIFDPFFTTRFPGRGLGLAVALGVVKRHGGAVSVRSRPDAGSCFGLYLPLTRATEREVVLTPAKPRAERTDGRALSVLVVDDEEHVREFVRIALRARGHRVAVAADGESALTAFADLRAPTAAVALVDLTMPGVDGRDVVRRLRELPHPPAIVLMSGHDVAHLVDTARELEADALLAKPFNVLELEAALATGSAARAAAR